MTYANPAWQAYNSDLTRITNEEKAIGPLIALNCGHFIQKDSPKFVSEELISLLDRVVNRVEQVSERVSRVPGGPWLQVLIVYLDTRDQKGDDPP